MISTLIVLAFTLIVPFTAGAADKDSCMDLACKLGHCKFGTHEIAEACAGATDSCVRAACKGNNLCKYEHDFMNIARDCTPKNQK